MNKLNYLSIFIVFFTGFTTVMAGEVEPAPNGIEFPADYRDWRVISTSNRIDNKTLRVILGNDVAIKAARNGKTNPWPNGAILAKVVFKQGIAEHWSQAIVPKKFVHVEFMVKDTKKYASTGNWGYARWLGNKLKPHGENSNFAKTCVACHTPVKSNDYVFTEPAPMYNLPQK